MRARIMDGLYAAMEADRDVFFLTADMGINLVERFAEAFPDRFLNTGIAEQNLIGVAAGLANAGFRPFCYTISNFLVHRAFEQIRNDVILHNHPVTLLGTSIGFENPALGPTHHVVDDWGPLRSFPGIEVYCPSTVSNASGLVPRLLERRRPAYVRISKGSFEDPRLGGEAAVYLKSPAAGDLVVCYGSTVPAGLEIFEQGAASLLVVNRLQPLDDAVAEAVGEHARVLVVEDHQPVTGLYGALCEMVQSRGMGARIRGAGPRGWCLEAERRQASYHARFGMDAGSIRRLVAAGS